MRNKIGSLLFKKIFTWYIIAAIFLTSLQIYNEYINYQRALENSLKTTSRIFMKPLGNAIWNLNSAQIEANTDSINKIQNIIGVKVLDNENKIISQQGAISTNKNNLSYNFNLYQGSEKIANVTLYSSHEIILNSMKNNVIMILVNSLVKSFILLLLFYYFTNKIITEVLEQLIGSIEKKELFKNYTDLSKDNEIGILINSYNEMQSRIQREILKNKLLDERLKLALLGSNDGVWDWDLLTDKVYYSPRYKEILGYEDHEFPNKRSSWKDNVHPEDLEYVMEANQDNIDGKTEYYEGVYRLRHKNGNWIWIRSRGKTIYDTDGKAIRMTGTHTDITKEKNEALKVIQQAQIIEQAYDSIIVLDLNGFIKSANRGTELLTGYKKEELEGSHLKILHSKEDYNKLYKIMQLVRTNGSLKDECKIIQKSKKKIDVSISSFLLHDSQKNPIGVVSYAQDITYKKEALDQLIEQKNILDYKAHHDVLTNLPNRLFFTSKLTQEIQNFKINQKKIAVLFIDLDEFKQINDSFGHDIGDEVLIEVSKKLKNTLKIEDTLARLGGDEFIIILKNLDDIKEASTVATQILNIFTKMIQIDQHDLYLSCSVGISIFPNDGDNTSDLLKFADAAMYKAKAEGRNNFQFYHSSMTEMAFEKVELEASLRKALQNNEFVVHYQPQVNGATDKLIGMEALVRWEHPTMGMISPFKFIPLAESTGLIVELDRYVMLTAMTQLSKWYKDGYNPGVLAMNLAIKQLQKEDFIPMFESLITRSKCQPEWLELEVTESQIMNHPEEAIRVLNKISELGIELAVDDFGTGYSSLAYLKKLPIDKLKIDQAFIKDLPGDEEDSAIANAIITLSKSLNLKIIAEGVETIEQKEFIVKQGCDNIQGYFYSKPVSAIEFESFLKEGFKTPLCFDFPDSQEL